MILKANYFQGGSSTEFDNYALYMSSLKRVRDLAPDTVYTGHGIVEGRETIDRYIAHRTHRENAVLRTLRAQERPVSVEDLTAEVYKADNLVNAVLVAAAGRIVGLMLEKMRGEGAAVAGAGGLWTALQ